METLPNIEEPYKAVPVRYVREAQQGLEERIYDEVWAVFDKDGHPKHQEAFELAEQIIEGKKVNIAFSSIAFEQWLLLHFEKNKSAFYKSECKENKEPLLCGTSSFSKDCYGEKCVIGYLRIANYLPDYTKGRTSNVYALVKKMTLAALENAAWLRHQLKDDITKTPVYELNPYTNVDVLVKRLLEIDEETIWTSLGEKLEVNGIELYFQKNDKNSIKVQFTNKSDRTFILPSKPYIKIVL